MYPVYYVYYRSRDRIRCSDLSSARKMAASFNSRNGISVFEYLGIIRVSNLGRATGYDYQNGMYSSLMQRHARY